MTAISPSPFHCEKEEKIMRHEIIGDVAILYDSHGRSFKIDADQLDKVNQYNWYVGRKGYVRTASRKANKITLHRYLMGTNELIDHINRDATDNRLCNLRLCTIQENNRNRVFKNKSGAQGVSYIEAKKRYRARICVDKKRIVIGYYKTLDEAKDAYNKKAAEIFGDYSPR